MYLFTIALINGNAFCSLSRWTRPCTNVAGARKKKLKSIEAKKVPVLRIQSSLNGI